MMERIRASSAAMADQQPSPVLGDLCDLDCINQSSYVQAPQPGDLQTCRVEVDPITVTLEVSGTMLVSSNEQVSPLCDHSDCHYYNQPSSVDPWTLPGPYPDDENVYSYWTRVSGSSTDTDRAFGDENNDIWLPGRGGDQSMLLDDFWNEEDVGLL